MEYTVDKKNIFSGLRGKHDDKFKFAKMFEHELWIKVNSDDAAAGCEEFDMDPVQTFYRFR